MTSPEPGHLVRRFAARKQHVAERDAERMLGPSQRSVSLTALHAGAPLEPRMAQLETLEAKMASIEVSLSAAARRKKPGGSLGSARSHAALDSSPGHAPGHAPGRSHSVMETSTHDDAAARSPLRDNAETRTPPAARLSGERERLARLRLEMDGKRLAIKNLKLALTRLHVTDNIDVRIQQAELEFQLGREELNLLTCLEQSRALTLSLEEAGRSAAANTPTLHSAIAGVGTGQLVSLHAAALSCAGSSLKFGAGPRDGCAGLWVQWAAPGCGLHKSDRLVEVNGVCALQRTKEQLQRLLAAAEPALIVVMRCTAERAATLASNVRLTHRISYLEDQVAQLLSPERPSEPERPGSASAVFQKGRVTALVTEPALHSTTLHVRAAPAAKPAPASGSDGNDRTPVSARRQSLSSKHDFKEHAAARTLDFDEQAPAHAPDQSPARNPEFKDHGLYRKQEFSEPSATRTQDFLEHGSTRTTEYNGLAAMRPHGLKEHLSGRQFDGKQRLFGPRAEPGDNRATRTSLAGGEGAWRGAEFDGSGREESKHSEDSVLRDDHRARDELKQREDHRIREELKQREDHRIRDDLKHREDHRFRDDVIQREDHRIRDDIKQREDYRNMDELTQREDQRKREDLKPREDYRLRDDLKQREDHRIRDDMKQREDHRIRDDMKQREDHRIRDDLRKREDHRLREEARLREDLSYLTARKAQLSAFLEDRKFLDERKRRGPDDEAFRAASVRSGSSLERPSRAAVASEGWASDRYASDSGRPPPPRKPARLSLHKALSLSSVVPPAAAPRKPAKRRHKQAAPPLPRQEKWC